MTRFPERQGAEDLAQAAAVSAAQFRSARLAVSDGWAFHYQDARQKFELLLATLSDLNPEATSNAHLAKAYRLGLGEALRYLAGPPISDDDLRVLADVDSLAPGVLQREPESLRKVFDVIERVIDPHRFPWIGSGSGPSGAQREAALLASSVLLAAQRMATARRNDGKEDQESALKDYLRSLGFQEVPAAPIHTLVKGPQPGQFCAECQLGERKADVVVRLHDTRLMPIECKVSNSATNSVKRLNNDAAVKAEYWIKQFGAAQVVPAAALSGVFKVLNLQQAQVKGLALFWSHDWDRLGRFIEEAR